MLGARRKIEFVGNATVAGPSGGASATLGYRFRINETSEVTVWAPLFVGKLSQEEVKDLTRKQIEREIANGMDLTDGTHLALEVLS